MLSAAVHRVAKLDKQHAASPQPLEACGKERFGIAKGLQWLKPNADRLPGPIGLSSRKQAAQKAVGALLEGIKSLQRGKPWGRMAGALPHTSGAGRSDFGLHALSSKLGCGPHLLYELLNDVLDCDDAQGLSLRRICVKPSALQVCSKGFCALRERHSSEEQHMVLPT